MTFDGPHPLFDALPRRDRVGCVHKKTGVASSVGPGRIQLIAPACLTLIDLKLTLNVRPA